MALLGNLGLSQEVDMARFLQWRNEDSSSPHLAVPAGKFWKLIRIHFTGIWIRDTIEGGRLSFGFPLHHADFVQAYIFTSGGISWR